VDSVRLLLEAGAAADDCACPPLEVLCREDGDGYTPHFARLLLAHGADADRCDDHGNTLFRIAEESGNHDVSDLMFAHQMTRMGDYADGKKKTA
jgi:ankyrin repeat protein